MKQSRTYKIRVRNPAVWYAQHFTTGTQILRFHNFMLMKKGIWNVLHNHRVNTTNYIQKGKTSHQMSLSSLYQISWSEFVKWRAHLLYHDLVQFDSHQYCLLLWQVDLRKARHVRLIFTIYCWWMDDNLLPSSSAAMKIQKTVSAYLKSK